MYTVASSARGILYVAFPGEEARMRAWLKKPAPEALPGANRKLEATAKEQLREFFEGKRRAFELPLDLRGTPSQKKVWQALTRIPYGKTISYGEQARRLGNPGAARAVGGANNRNPIAIIIPCHRVIGSSGHLTGYASGLKIKKFLLDLESQ